MALTISWKRLALPPFYQQIGTVNTCSFYDIHAKAWIFDQQLGDFGDTGIASFHNEYLKMLKHSGIMG